MDNVAIVFSSDKNYFPVLEVSLYSLIEHLSHEKTYKLFVLSEDVSEEDVQSLATFLRNAIPTKHFSLELRKTNEVFFSDEKLFYTEIHVSKETYLRFYIPELF